MFKKIKGQDGYTLKHINGSVDVSYNYSFGKKEIWVSVEYTAEGKQKSRQMKTVVEAKEFVEKKLWEIF
jgi:hypothetical protein